MVKEGKKKLSTGRKTLIRRRWRLIIRQPSGLHEGKGWGK